MNYDTNTDINLFCRRPSSTPTSTRASFVARTSSSPTWRTGRGSDQPFAVCEIGCLFLLPVRSVLCLYHPCTANLPIVYYVMWYFMMCVWLMKHVMSCYCVR